MASFDHRARVRGLLGDRRYGAFEDVAIGRRHVAVLGGSNDAHEDHCSMLGVAAPAASVPVASVA
jgi:hypothetical protein